MKAAGLQAQKETLRVLNTFDPQKKEVQAALYVVLFTKRTRTSKHRRVLIPEALRYGTVERLSMAESATLLGLKLQSLTSVVTQAMTISSGLDPIESVSEFAQKNIRSAALHKDAPVEFDRDAQKRASKVAKDEFEAARPLLDAMRTESAMKAKRQC
eukprot:2309155-Amphidinium_carterae.1